MTFTPSLARNVLFGLLLAGRIVGAIAEDAQGNKRHRIPAVDGLVRVDGVLDEPFWREALCLNVAYEVSPGENTPAPVRTDAYLAHTRSHLMLGFRAFDPKPDKIRARFCDRDAIYE